MVNVVAVHPTVITVVEFLHGSVESLFFASWRRLCVYFALKESVRECVRG